MKKYESCYLPFNVFIDLRSILGIIFNYIFIIFWSSLILFSFYFSYTIFRNKEIQCRHILFLYSLNMVLCWLPFLITNAYSLVDSNIITLSELIIALIGIVLHRIHGFFNVLIMLKMIDFGER